MALVPRAVRLANKGVALHAPVSPLSENADEPAEIPISHQDQAHHESQPASKQQGQKQGKGYKQKLYQYGNYNKYYGYRKDEGEEGEKKDHRLEYLKEEWFAGKRCLDIGCNTGVLSFEIGRRFGYASLTGVDIDPLLIRRAIATRERLIAEAGPGADRSQAPFNTDFKAENFLESKHTATYDVVLCLTKWIHLNWGDTGIRKLFAGINHSLKPGGLLLLEPQEMRSYKKKSRLLPVFRENCQSIVLQPRFFADYLHVEYGFEKEDNLQVNHSKKGFTRPIFAFRKPVTPWHRPAEGWKPPPPRGPQTQEEAVGGDGAAKPKRKREPKHIRDMKKKQAQEAEAQAAAPVAAPKPVDAALPPKPQDAVKVEDATSGSKKRKKTAAEPVPEETQELEETAVEEGGEKQEERTTPKEKKKHKKRSSKGEKN